LAARGLSQLPSLLSSATDSHNATPKTLRGLTGSPLFDVLIIMWQIVAVCICVLFV
jgi:hypothetical protein